MLLNCGVREDCFFFLIYFNWRQITLQYCSEILSDSLSWVSHRCTWLPHPECPSLFPPHPIPQGPPSSPALSTLSHASNLHWQSISHVVIYMGRRLLRVPWTARRSNQSILKEISLEYSLEGLMLKLKLQAFGNLMQRTDSLEKTLMLGKIEGRREGDNRGWHAWMESLNQQTWVWAKSGWWWRTGKPSVLQSMEFQRVGHDWVTEQPQILSVHTLCPQLPTNHSFPLVRMLPLVYLLMEAFRFHLRQNSSLPPHSTSIRYSLPCFFIAFFLFFMSLFFYTPR